MTRQPTATAESARLATINRVAAVAFILGGSLFALGAVFAQLGEVALLTVNITYLVGGFFFSLGGYASVLLAVNTGLGNRGDVRAGAACCGGATSRNGATG